MVFRVPRVHLKELSRYERGLLSEQRFVAVKAIIKRDIILWLRISLRNKERREVLLEGRHHHICFIILVDSGGDDQLAKVAIFRDCLLEK